MALAQLTNLPNPFAAWRIVKERYFNSMPCLYRYQHGGNSLCFYIPSKEHYSNLFSLLNRMAPKALFQKQSMSTPPDSTPCFIPIKMVMLDSLNQVSEKLTPQIQEWMKQSNIHLLFDLSGESLNDNPDATRYLLSFHRYLQQAGIPAERVHLITANRCEQFYPLWSQQHSPQYRIHCYGYHFYIYAIPQKAITSMAFPWYRHQLIRTARSGKLRPKHFMCLNLKPRVQRWAVLLLLIKNNYLDKGLVTYIGSKSAPRNPESQPYLATPDLINLLEKVPDAPSLLTYYDRLERMRPLTYERSLDAMYSMWRTPGDLAYIIPELEYHQGKTRIDTYFEIVSETYFSDEKVLYITEKTLRPMFRLQPFIHVGSPFVLRELRKMGFKTFSPVINESYDEIPNPKERLVAIFNEIKRLCDMPLEDLHAEYMKLLDVYEYNFNHIITQMPHLLLQDVTNNIFGRLNTELRTYHQAA